jgi:ubiquinone/menaquinone biosynthesis C-methylase UbiE
MPSPYRSAVDAYWGRGALEQAIDDALAGVGKDPRALTLEDLATVDHFHGGGRASTQRLARRAGLRPGMRVLDVGGGLGGPARTLAAEFGCLVTVVDLTESYVEAGRALTARVGLADRVRHVVGDALALPAGSGTFDAIWTENSGMNIADKSRLYQGFAGLLAPGAVLALQEPMAGPNAPPVYPQMWARDASTSFLWTPEAMRATIEAAGFACRAWDDVTRELPTPSSGASVPPQSIARIVMGDAIDAITAAARRNRDEGRVVMVQAVFARSAPPRA